MAMDVWLASDYFISISTIRKLAHAKSSFMEAVVEMIIVSPLRKTVRIIAFTKPPIH